MVGVKDQELGFRQVEISGGDIQQTAKQRVLRQVRNTC